MKRLNISILAKKQVCQGCWKKGFFKQLQNTTLLWSPHNHLRLEWTNHAVANSQAKKKHFIFLLLSVMMLKCYDFFLCHHFRLCCCVVLCVYYWHPPIFLRHICTYVGMILSSRTHTCGETAFVLKMTPMVSWSDFNIDCWFKKKTFQKKQNVVEE